MSDARDIEVLAEEIRKIREELKLRPILRQGIVVGVDAGPPQLVAVFLGEAVVQGVRCLPGYTALDADPVWLLILPGGVRIAIGDLA